MVINSDHVRHCTLYVDLYTCTRYTVPFLSNCRTDSLAVIPTGTGSTSAASARNSSCLLFFGLVLFDHRSLRFGCMWVSHFIKLFEQVNGFLLEQAWVTRVWTWIGWYRCAWCVQFHDGPTTTKFFIAAPKIDRTNAYSSQCSSTHDAWFDGHIQFTLR